MHHDCSICNAGVGKHLPPIRITPRKENDMTTNEKSDNRRSHIVTAIALALAAALFGTIIYAVASMPPKAGSYADKNATEVVVLDGAWKSTSDDPNFRALIKNGTIEVYFVADDTSSLYWKGTFPWNKGDESVPSTADVAALEGSLLGSQAKQKRFLYNGDNLLFDFTIMGTTTTITMEKV